MADEGLFLGGQESGIERDKLEQQRQQLEFEKRKQAQDTTRGYVDTGARVGAAVATQGMSEAAAAGRQAIQIAAEKAAAQKANMVTYPGKVIDSWDKAYPKAGFSAYPKNADGNVVADYRVMESSKAIVAEQAALEKAKATHLIPKLQQFNTTGSDGKPVVQNGWFWMDEAGNPQFHPVGTGADKFAPKAAAAPKPETRVQITSAMDRAQKQVDALRKSGEGTGIAGTGIAANPTKAANLKKWEAEVAKRKKQLDSMQSGDGATNTDAGSGSTDPLDAEIAKRNL